MYGLLCLPLKILGFFSNFFQVKTRLSDVQAAVRQLLPADAILCGQSLNGDLHALEMSHPYVIDTSVIFNLSGRPRAKSSLKTLTQFFLNKSIQGTDKFGHDSIEDSRATMELVLLKLTHGVTFGDCTLGWEIPVGQTSTMEVAVSSDSPMEEISHAPILNDAVEEVSSAPILNDAVEEVSSAPILKDAVEEVSSALILNDVVEEVSSALILNDVVEEVSSALILKDAVEEETSMRFPRKRKTDDDRVASPLVGAVIPSVSSHRKSSVLECATCDEKKRAYVVGSSDYVRGLADAKGKATVQYVTSTRRVLKRAAENLLSFEFVFADLHVSRKDETEDQKVKNLQVCQSHSINQPINRIQSINQS